MTNQSGDRSDSTRDDWRIFVANLRHDLRTPLNAIIGYSEMVLEEAEDLGEEELVDLLNLVVTNGREILGVVDDVLSASRMQSLAEPDWSGFEKELRSGTSERAQTVLAVSRRLLSAFKSKRLGEFCPDIEKVQTAAERFLEESKDIPSRAEDFQAEETAQDERAGLAGQVLEKAEPRSGGAERNGKILVVDDNEMNRDLLQRHLVKLGHEALLAEGGEEALQKISEESFDLVLLDVMMPGMDGHQVLQRLKADPSLRDVPVIMISALAELSSVVRCIENGAEDYLQKPFDPVLLNARVGACLEKKWLHDREEEQRRELARLNEELVKSNEIIKLHSDRMEEELNIGREIQMSLVPLTFPYFVQHKEFTVWGTLQPAREVGGDFYDFFFVDSDLFCFCIADVAGKGVPSALFMAVAKTLIKSHAVDGFSPASILTHVNDELSRDNETFMFVTVFAGILNIKTGELVYTNAGHNPPYVIRKDGEVKRLAERHGPVIGAIEGITLSESRLILSPGDRLFTYTDGVTEAMDSLDNLYGEERLASFLPATRHLSVQGLVESTIKELDQFALDAEQADDIAILAIEFTGPEGGADQVFTMTMVNDLAEIAEVEGRFSAFLTDRGVPEKIVSKVSVVLDELLGNIVLYAFRDSDERQVEVKVVVSAGCLTLTISDDGIPFNPFRVDAPDTTLAVEEREVGGLGIHLVRNIMDEVSYIRKSNRNVVVLTKLLPDGGIEN